MDKKCNDIFKYLNNLFENEKCELEFGSNFQLLVAVILSARCTDKRVNLITKELFKEYKTPQDFLLMGQNNLEQKIYSCGFYKNKAENIICASKDIVEKFDGVVPDTFEQLTSLSGVGRKTANVVLSEGFKKPAIAVDTHVFRVSHRLGLSNKSEPEKVEKDLQQLFDKSLWSSLHKNMVLFGRYYCKSLKPECEKCELKKYCNFYKEKI